MILLPGARVIFVELKTKTGRVSPAQSRFLIFLRSLGFSSVIIRGKDELKEFIENHVKA